MSDTYLMIDDFSGGMNSADRDLYVPRNQHRRIYNLLPEGGGLQLAWGRENQVVSGLPTTGPLDAAYDFTHRNTAGAEVTYRIAIKDGVIYMETTPSGVAGGVYRALYNTLSDPGTGYVSGKWPGAFAESKGYLYISALGGKRTVNSMTAAAPLVWDGKMSAILGTGTVAAGTPTLVTLSTNLVLAVKGRRITLNDGVNCETQTIVDVQDAGTSAYVGTAFAHAYAAGTPVLISKIDYLGMDAPATFTAAVSAGAGLTAGLYKYKMIFRNSTRGVSSGQSPVVEVTVLSAGSNKQVTLSAIVEEPLDVNSSKWGQYQSDYLRIYRTAVNGDVYYLVESLARDEGTPDANTYKFPATYVDSMSDATLMLATNTVWAGEENNSLPPAVNPIYAFNDRLWGIDALRPEELACSTVGQPDYWPRSQFNVDAPDTALTNLGTYWRIGSGGDPVMALCPEVGSFSQTGNIGADILVFTASRAERIFGYDLSEFKREAAFNHGCTAWRSLQNCGGKIVWQSRDGLLAVDAGGSTPIELGKPIRNLVPSYGTQFQEVGASESVAVFWRNYYIISMVDPITSAVRCFACYLPSPAWVELHLKAINYHVSPKANSDALLPGGKGDLLYCPSDGDGVIYRAAPWHHYLNPSTLLGMNFAFESGPLNMATNPMEEVSLKFIERVAPVIITEATADWTLTVTVRPYAVRNVTPQSFNRTVECDGLAYNGTPRIEPVYPHVHAVWCTISLSGETVQ